MLRPAGQILRPDRRALGQVMARQHGAHGPEAAEHTMIDAGKIHRVGGQTKVELPVDHPVADSRGGRHLQGDGGRRVDFACRHRKGGA
jgi:hypothetical protein